MTAIAPTVTPVLIPDNSAVRFAYKSVDLSDAYSIALPSGTSTDPEELARHIFNQRMPWVTGLMAIRDFAVAGLGLKTSRRLSAPGAAGGGRVGIFRIYQKLAHEIILGEDDKHLDFRLSVLVVVGAEEGMDNRVVVSTVVHCHNALGRVYILAIERFHRLIVKSFLRRAAIAGWPKAHKA